MLEENPIDVDFDFRSDRRPGVDPDALRGGSPTLREYHRRLWSRPLPSGVTFDLDAGTPGEYLHHRSELGEFFLSSDSLIHTYDYGYGNQVKPITDLYSAAEREAFERATYTIGGMLIFPSNRVNGKQTINQLRGTSAQVKDRFDLTLESIRRYYSDGSSPLQDTIAAYPAFFGLFGDFRGYVDYFLLQDLVTDDYSAIRFSLPFDDFKRSPLPASIDEYKAYRAASLDFIETRNRRIATSLSVGEGLHGRGTNS
jgi:hypothetical protein